jgi:hypothetical protein
MTIQSSISQLDKVDAQANLCAWAGTDEGPVYEESIHYHDWRAGPPALMVVYHGTTHVFSAFDIKHSAHRGAMGKVHYFTSSYDDAKANYANGNGPDLRAKIDDLVDRATQYPEDLPELAGMTEPQIEDWAKNQLVGSVEKVHELYVKTIRPFHVNSDFAKHTLVFPDHDEEYDALLAQIASENDVEPDDVLEADTLADLFYEKEGELADEKLNSLHNAFDMACRQAGVDNLEFPDIDCSLIELTHNALLDIFEDNTDLLTAEDQDGHFASMTLFSRTVENLGFDSIIILHADEKFSAMNMNPNTTHVHLFDQTGCQLKSVDNIGIFNPEVADIYL